MECDDLLDDLVGLAGLGGQGAVLDGKDGDAFPGADVGGQLSPDEEIVEG